MLFNRDLSWLGFNLRVLQEATDKKVALYDRLKFLAIFSANLDEFFRVRYPAVIALSNLTLKTQKKANIEVSEDIAQKIQNEVNRQLDVFGAILTNELIPDFKKNGIIFYYNSPVKEEHIEQINEIFLSNVLSFIQPVYLEGESNRDFMPENNQLYFVVTLKEHNHGTLRQALVNIPSCKLKRFFSLSPINGDEYVIFLDDIIRENMHYIFSKLEIISIYSIKFNRNAELNLADEYSGNLLNKIEKQLKKRDINLPSRFLYEQGMPRNLQLFLAGAFSVKFEDMFAGGRYHHLSDLSSFPVFNNNLQPVKFRPLPGKITGTEIFNVLAHQDVLLHLPYQSYNTVLSFFNQASVDDDVTDIYITLYRLASESHIVNALISAARNGKNVVVFIELKARFDEANNIKWSRIMKEAGINLVYSMPQIKVHSKIALVKKKVKGREMAYAILSTGNFNEVTAQFYTDHVLLTSNAPVISEMLALFQFLEKGNNQPGETRIKFNALLVSQFNMIEELEKRIAGEIKKARKGEEARIRIKVNNLEEPVIISLLYKASQAGVKIDLIVRSVCCIVPGIAGLSENITVYRIVDRFLEHSRLFIFGIGEDAVVFMGSSDLMTRNLHHRIEVCVEIKDSYCRKELIDYFELQWSDNTKAVKLMPDNLQVRLNGHNGSAVNAQTSIYQYLKSRS